MRRAGTGEIDEEGYVVAGGKRVQGRAEDLVFQPKAGNDQARNIFTSKRIDKRAIEPGTLVFFELELALWSGRRLPSARQGLRFSSPRQGKDGHAYNAGGFGDDGGPLVMPGRQAGRARQGLRCHQDQRANGWIEQRRMADVAALHGFPSNKFAAMSSRMHHGSSVALGKARCCVHTSAESAEKRFWN